jgi:hypothetical protein
MIQFGQVGLYTIETGCDVAETSQAVEMNQPNVYLCPNVIENG